MNETEIPIKVTDIQGVSNQILGEDLPPNYCSLLENLYERRIGELMRKGGTSQIATTFPNDGGSPAVSSIEGLDNAFILRKKTGEKVHIQAVHTNPMGPSSFAQRASASFVTTFGGNWGTVIGSPANTKLDCNGTIAIQYIGYGCNFCEELAVIRGANNTLRITVPADLDPRVLGLNIYANVDVWNAISGFENSIWVGYIDLNLPGSRGTTYDFTQAPITQSAAPGVAGVMFGGPTKPNFTLSPSNLGTLTPGKTYYVSVLEQYVSNGNSNLCSVFRARETTVQSITLPPTANAIAVAPTVGPAGDSACYMIAIGEDPQLLQPIFITNVFTNPSDVNYIRNLPTASPNLCGITPRTSDQDYSFQFCDSSTLDMFFRYDGISTRPVYVSRTTNINKLEYDGATDFIYAKSGIFNFYQLTWQTGAMPDGARYRFTQLGSAGFAVCSGDIVENNRVGGLGALASKLYSTTYLITDGRIFGQVIFDFGTTPVPKSQFITTFQESIAVGGGPPGSEAYGNVYFSNAYNPANFSTTGTGTALAFVGLEAAGEPVMGMGIFSITTADSGINTQFLVGTRTKLFKLNAIPDSTSFGSAFMDQLSNKVGLASHETICQTEIGTIITGLDDVYLVRDSGEPSPVGQDIANFINPPEKTTGLSTSYWNAVYHDGHYKLAYSLPGQDDCTRELWLNVRKMKAKKGMPSWVGPHTGRSFHYAIVDEPLNQGDLSRRIIVDIDADRNYYADDPAYLQDMGSDIPTVFEKEFIGDSGEFANKKLVRFQIRGRATGRINFESSWSADGVLLENGITPFVPKQNVSDILSQTSQVFPFFPVKRVRGRVLKYRLKSLTKERFGISGLLVGMRPERRRI